MEKLQITQGNDIITIGDVVLTKDAIYSLTFLQEDSNEGINEMLAALGNTVCFLAKTKIHWGGSWVPESESLIQQLSFVHGYFSDLKKPVENILPPKLEETAKRDKETK